MRRSPLPTGTLGLISMLFVSLLGISDVAAQRVEDVQPPPRTLSGFEKGKDGSWATNIQLARRGLTTLTLIEDPVTTLQLSSRAGGADRPNARSIGATRSVRVAPTFGRFSSGERLVGFSRGRILRGAIFSSDGQGFISGVVIRFDGANFDADRFSGSDRALGRALTDDDTATPARTSWRGSRRNTGPLELSPAERQELRERFADLNEEFVDWAFWSETAEIAALTARVPDGIVGIQRNQDFVRAEAFPSLFDRVVQTKSCDDIVVIKGTLEPSFSWTMPPRYGLDRNNNSIVDLPNTAEYVANEVAPINTDGYDCRPGGGRNCATAAPRFAVLLNAETAPYRATLKTEEELDAELEAAGCLDQERTGRTLIREAQEDMVGFSEDDDLFHLWFIQLEDGTVQVWGRGPGEPNKLRVFLPEGRHRITLIASIEDDTDDYFGNAAWVKKPGRAVLTQALSVEDHLIVQLGDSYGAGEGAPEKRFGDLFEIEIRDAVTGAVVPESDLTNIDFGDFSRFAKGTWADTGYGYPTKSHRLRATNRRTGNPVSATTRMPDIQRILDERAPAYDPNDKYRIYTEHIASHRSSFTHSSQLAIALENADDQSSVTYINLAQSGAGLDRGVLGLYGGYPEDIMYSGSAFLTTLGLVYCAVRVQTRGEVVTFPDKMCSQAYQLEQMLGTRTVDHLVIHAGGNDGGFANIIAMALVAFRYDLDDWKDYAAERLCDENDRKGGETICDLYNAAFDGEWKRRVNGFELEALPDPIDEKGIDGLPDLYAALDGRLSQMAGISEEDTQIYLMTPPFFGVAPDAEADAYEVFLKVDETSSLTPPQTNRQYDNRRQFCTARVDTDPGENDEFDAREVEFVYREIFPELRGAMLDAADLYGWNKVNILINNIYDHGWCGRRIYQREEYSPSHPIDLTARNRTGEAANDAGVAWYRDPFTGSAIQKGSTKTNKGMFHPNEFGYAHARDMLGEAFMRTRYIDAGNAFDADLNDTIAAAPRPRSNGSGVRRGNYIYKANDTADVDIAKFRVPAGWSLDLNMGQVPVANPTSECAAITLFTENGAVLKTSSPRLRRAMNAAAKGEGLKQRTGRPGLDTGSDCEVWRVGGTATPEEDRQFMERGGETKIKFVNTTSETMTIFAAVSHHTNVWFDPLTGKGDVTPGPTEIYGRIDFKVAQP